MGKKSNCSKRNEVVRLENEVVIFEIVFGIIHRSLCEKIPHIPFLIIYH
jgi:hypothetical protein